MAAIGEKFPKFSASVLYGERTIWWLPTVVDEPLSRQSFNLTFKI